MSIVEVGKQISATSTGVKKSGVYRGSATGKDGIHGASFLPLRIWTKTVLRISHQYKLEIRSKRNCCWRRLWSWLKLMLS